MRGSPMFGRERWLHLPHQHEGRPAGRADDVVEDALEACSVQSSGTAPPRTSRPVSREWESDSTGPPWESPRRYRSRSRSARVRRLRRAVRILLSDADEGLDLSKLLVQRRECML